MSNFIVLTDNADEVRVVKRSDIRRVYKVGPTTTVFFGGNKKNTPIRMAMSVSAFFDTYLSTNLFLLIRGADKKNVVVKKSSIRRVHEVFGETKVCFAAAKDAPLTVLGTPAHFFTTYLED